MSDADVELVRELFDCLARGDFETGRFYDPAVVYVRVGSDTPAAAGEWYGLAEMTQALLDWLRAWENLRVQAERIIDLDGRVLVLPYETATGRRSGVAVEQKTGHLVTVRDGKIVRHESYWHRSEALRAAGLEELPE